MPSYLANSSVPDFLQSYEKGGEMLLFGVRDVETLREADLCWNVAQFYAVASKSNSTLQQAIQIIKTFEDLFNQWESEIANHDSATRHKLRDLRKQREDLQLTILRLQVGFDSTVQEFQKAQGSDDDTEMEVLEDATLEVVGEDSDADGGNGVDAEMDDSMEVGK